ncbi:hypothetical protein ACFE04_031970 [Oxalis oulophora]
MIFVREILLLLLIPFVTSRRADELSRIHQHSLLRDKDALLKFKNSVISDPNSTMASWNESVHVCNFQGVTCDKYGHRVARLELPNSNLSGPLSPFISNLTGLRVLNLSENFLFGKIPPEFSYLRHLRHLKLHDNNLHGSIPVSLSLLTNLTLIALNINKLNGTLPPAFFSNCSLLRNVDISYNFLTGTIPEEIGNCPNLWTLNLYNNNFTGRLPQSLTNTSLSNLDVENNHLSGELPSVLLKNLPGLVYLHLSYNNMVSHDENTNLGPFFDALRNCKSLKEIEMAGMGLGGSLPSSIGQLGVNFTLLLLQANQIFGSIPPEIGLLSNLTTLNLSSNFLNGTISPEIGKLGSLGLLSLSNNFFSTTLPEALGQLSRLDKLDLSNNKFHDAIPESLGNLFQVSWILLNNNLLSGKIPPSLGRCTDLYKLDLSYNRLTGRIPPALTGLRDIRIFFNLSHNQLNGPLPIELSKLENVQEIDLSSNNLTGKILPEISRCIALRKIDLSQNSLQGDLPNSLGDLKNLEWFDVSGNNLSGTIPISLSKISTLVFLNLSVNHFHGTIPSGGIFDLATNLSFLGNKDLCGKIRGMQHCSEKTRWIHSRVFLPIFIVVISVCAFLTTICGAVLFRRIKIMVSSRKSGTDRRSSTPELIHNFPRMTYRELSDATQGFDEQRLLGAGSYGRVFKGVLPDGRAIAVKVLNLQTGNSTKSFNRECQVLKRIRHRNLMRIITACSLPDFKAIVLPYMANGKYGFGTNTSIKGDVYSFGILVLEMVTRKRPTDDMFIDGLSLTRWVKNHYHGRFEKIVDSSLMRASRDQSTEVKKAWEVAIRELIELGILCTQDSPANRPTMLDAADDLDRLKRYLNGDTTATFNSSLGISSSTLDDD